MRPLVFTSYQSLINDFSDTMSQENLCGFIFDSPKTRNLYDSGLLTNMTSRKILNSLMLSKMSLYYLNPGQYLSNNSTPLERRELSKRISEFNVDFIKGLNLPFSSDFPMAIFFKFDDGNFIYLDHLEFGTASCLYFFKLHQMILDILEKYHSDSDFLRGFLSNPNICKIKAGLMTGSLSFLAQRALSTCFAV